MPFLCRIRRCISWSGLSRGRAWRRSCEWPRFDGGSAGTGLRASAGSPVPQRVRVGCGCCRGDCVVIRWWRGAGRVDLAMWLGHPCPAARRARARANLKRAAGELARDRQRGASVAEAAGLERGGRRGGTAGRKRGLIERPAQLARASAGELADPSAARPRHPRAQPARVLAIGLARPPFLLGSSCDHNQGQLRPNPDAPRFSPGIGDRPAPARGVRRAMWRQGTRGLCRPFASRSRTLYRSRATVRHPLTASSGGMTHAFHPDNRPARTRSRRHRRGPRRRGPTANAAALSEFGARRLRQPRQPHLPAPRHRARHRAHPRHAGNTDFERISQFRGLRRGMTDVEATVGAPRRWVATDVERSGGGGEHGGHGGDDDHARPPACLRSCPEASTGQF